MPILNAKVFLEGPYVAAADTMQRLLGAHIPLTQPYSGSPWNYSGTESVSGIPAGVVDWMLVELRTGTAAATKVATRAAFIKTDGSVVDLDGTNPVAFPSVDPGDYYVVVRHRNHLAIMSKNPVSLSTTSTLYDFTTGQVKAYGTVPMKLLAAGAYGMYAGDANGSGDVTILDRAVWRTQNGTTGYLGADFNLTGDVSILDRAIWRLNNSLVYTGAVSHQSGRTARTTPAQFNPRTTIRYGLPNRSQVLLTVFNTLPQ